MCVLVLPTSNTCWASMMTTTKDDESGVMLGCVDVVDGLIHSKHTSC
jgi:hypothetical protein